MQATSPFLVFLLTTTPIFALDWQWELDTKLHYIPSEQEYIDREIRIDHLYGAIYFETLQFEGPTTPKSLQIVQSYIDEIEDGALCVTPFETIRFHGNEKLPKFTGDLFGNCPKLTALYIGSNNDWTFEPDAFAGLENLESLRIWNQRSVKQIEGLLLPSLVQFEVNHAPALTHIDFGLFDKMVRLKEIKLSWNGIDRLTGEFGKSLTEVRSLDLSENPLMEKFPWQVLKNLENLNTLNFSASQVIMDVSEIVENVPNLDKIHMGLKPVKCNKRKDLAQDLVGAFGGKRVKVEYGDCDDKE